MALLSRNAPISGSLVLGTFYLDTVTYKYIHWPLLQDAIVVNARYYRRAFVYLYMHMNSIHRVISGSHSATRY